VPASGGGLLFAARGSYNETIVVSVTFLSDAFRSPLLDKDEDLVRIIMVVLGRMLLWIVLVCETTLGAATVVIVREQINDMVVVSY
jgi:hypothetical protein